MNLPTTLTYEQILTEKWDRYYSMDMEKPLDCLKLITIFTFLEHYSSPNYCFVIEQITQRGRVGTIFTNSDDLLDRLVSIQQGWSGGFGFCCYRQKYFIPKPKNDHGSFAQLMIMTHLIQNVHWPMWIIKEMVSNFVPVIHEDRAETLFWCASSVHYNLRSSSYQTKITRAHWFKDVICTATIRSIVPEDYMISLYDSQYWADISAIIRAIWEMPAISKGSSLNAEVKLRFIFQSRQLCLVLVEPKAKDLHYGVITPYCHHYYPYRHCIFSTYLHQNVTDYVKSTNQYKEAVSVLVRITHPPKLEWSRSLRNNIRFGLEVLVYKPRLIASTEFIDSGYDDEKTFDKHYHDKFNNTTRKALTGRAHSYFYPNYPKTETDIGYQEALTQSITPHILPTTENNPLILLCQWGFYNARYNEANDPQIYAKSTKKVGYDAWIQWIMDNEEAESYNTPMIYTPFDYCKRTFFGVNLDVEMVCQYGDFIDHHLRLLPILEESWPKKSVIERMLFICQILYNAKWSTSINQDLYLLWMDGNGVTINDSSSSLYYDGVTESLTRMTGPEDSRNRIHWLTALEQQRLLDNLTNPNDLTTTLVKQTTTKEIGLMIRTFIDVILLGNCDEVSHDYNPETGLIKMKGNLRTNEGIGWRQTVSDWIQWLICHQAKNSWQWTNSEQISLIFLRFLQKIGLSKRVLIYRTLSIPFNKATMNRISEKDDFMENSNFTILCMLRYPLGFLWGRIYDHLQAKLEKYYNTKITRDTLDMFLNSQLVVINLNGDFDLAFSANASSTVHNSILLPNLQYSSHDWEFFGVSSSSHTKRQSHLWISVAQTQIILSASEWIMFLKE